MNHFKKTIMLSFTIMSALAGAESISLKGDWNFKLDPDNLGIKEQWFDQKLTDKAKLPGSLDEQKLGFKNDEICLAHLTREYKYIGKAWYQKEVTIPENWSNERIVLFLERAMWETRVYVDGNYLGSQNSLCVPHVYNLTDFLSPGKHNITILVDNTVKINIGHTLSPWLWTHAITEETQTDWNGIIGRIELIATPKVWIDSIQTYPDFEKKITKVKVVIGNISGEKVDGKINLEDLTDNVSVNNISFSANENETVVDVNLPLHTMCQLVDTVYTQFPHYFEIDYVKVYQLKSDCENNYSICNYNNITYKHYNTITIGGEKCNVTVPKGETLFLTYSDKLNILSNFTLQKGAEILFERVPCFESVHLFPNKSDTIPQPAPNAFYKRSNPIYHE